MGNKKVKNNVKIDKNLIKIIKNLEIKYKLKIDLKLNKEKGLLSFKFDDREELDKLINKLNE